MDNMLISKILGFILITDAFLSLFLPQDKNLFWQAGRIVRLFIGIYFVYYA